MKKSSTRNLLVLFSALASVFLCIVVFGVYVIRQKIINTEEILSQVESGGNNSILIQSVQSAGTNPDSEVALLNNISVPEEELISLIELLESTGREMEVTVKISSVSIEDSVGEGRPRKINLRIETSGGWEKTMQYLRAIENLPYRTVISSSSLSAGETLNEVTSDSSASTTQGRRLRTVWKSSTSLSVYSFE